MDKQRLFIGCIVVSFNFLIVPVSLAQDHSYHICATDEASLEMLKKFPDLRVKETHYEELYRTKVSQEEVIKSHQRSAALYTIPVVVHIIHNGDPIGSADNPTDAEIAGIVAEASQRFRHQHPGAGAYSNPNYGVDTEIELCLASVDPDGNFSSGVTRHFDPVNSIGSYNTLVPGLTAYQWDITKYCNLFIVKEMTNAAGVYVYNGTFDATIYNGGNSFWSGLIAHEVGHYFSLIHTFGLNNGCPANTDCLIDGDRVCDTPPKGTSGFGGAPNCQTPNNSCTTDDDDLSANNPYRPVSSGGLGDQPDMLSNYLDYTGSCWDSYTLGQKARMRFNIENNRLSLKNYASIACNPQPAPAYNLAVTSVSENHSPCQSSFTPSVSIKNNGTATVTSFTLKFFLDQSLKHTQTWNGSLAPGGTISLGSSTPIMTAIGSYILRIRTESPNGNQDANIYDDENYGIIYFGGDGTNLPYAENLNVCEAPANYLYNNWQFTSTSQNQSCQGCAAYLVAFNNTPAEYSMSLPLINLAAITDPVLTFKLGHIPRYDFIPNDEIRVEVSTHCNSPSIVYQKTALAKATNNPPAYSAGIYTIPDCSQFRTETIDLSAFSGQNQVQITFVADGEWWSPIVIDDIEITGNSAVCGSAPPASGAISAGTYHISGALQTAGSIAPPSNVIFKSGSEIILLNNFFIGSGATLETHIQSCSEPMMARPILDSEKDRKHQNRISFWSVKGIPVKKPTGSSIFMNMN